MHSSINQKHLITKWSFWLPRENGYYYCTLKEHSSPKQRELTFEISSVTLFEILKLVWRSHGHVLWVPGSMGSHVWKPCLRGPLVAPSTIKTRRGAVGAGAEHPKLVLWKVPASHSFPKSSVWYQECLIRQARLGASLGSWEHHLSLIPVGPFWSQTPLYLALLAWESSRTVCMIPLYIREDWGPGVKCYLWGHIEESRKL